MGCLELDNSALSAVIISMNCQKGVRISIFAAKNGLYKFMLRCVSVKRYTIPLSHFMGNIP